MITGCNSQKQWHSISLYANCRLLSLKNLSSYITFNDSVYMVLMYVKFGPIINFFSYLYKMKRSCCNPCGKQKYNITRVLYKGKYVYDICKINVPMSHDPVSSSKTAYNCITSTRKSLDISFITIYIYIYIYIYVYCDKSDITLFVLCRNYSIKK